MTAIQEQETSWLYQGASKEDRDDQIQAKPFTRIHGRPTRNDVDRLVRKARDTSVETQIPDFDWAGEPDLLAEVVGEAQYNTKTGKVYIEPVKPSAFDSHIRANMPEHLLKKYTAQTDQKIESWSVLLRSREAIEDNIIDTVDLMYYEQLKDKVLGYKQINIEEFLDHLKKWCKMNATARKAMKDEYLRGWSPDEHITAFTARLKRGKNELAVNEVTVTNDKIRDHCVIEMYGRDVFDKNKMTEYEKKADPEKNWATRQAYFEGVVGEHKEYENNTGGVGKRVKFDSAASVHKADKELGNDLRRYLHREFDQREGSQQKERRQHASGH